MHFEIYSFRSAGTGMPDAGTMESRTRAERRRSVLEFKQRGYVNPEPVACAGYQRRAVGKIIVHRPGGQRNHNFLPRTVVVRGIVASPGGETYRRCLRKSLLWDAGIAALSEH